MPTFLWRKTTLTTYTWLQDLSNEGQHFLDSWAQAFTDISKDFTWKKSGASCGKNCKKRSLAMEHCLNDHCCCRSIQRCLLESLHPVKCSPLFSVQAFSTFHIFADSFWFPFLVLLLHWLAVTVHMTLQLACKQHIYENECCSSHSISHTAQQFRLLQCNMSSTGKNINIKEGWIFLDCLIMPLDHIDRWV